MIRERDVAASDSDGIHVTLPDGSARTYPRGVTGAEVAASIGKGLAKAAFAVEVDGEIRDLSRPIDGDARVRILKTDDPDALPVLRHDAAHVMAEAVQDLYPGTQVTIGPAIENGFYYDFHREEPFTPDDLARIEARMAEIVKADKPFVRQEVSREDARRRFADMGERFKLELLDAIPEGEPVSLYHQDGWFDLCRGPHGPSTGRIGAFKLTKVAGAYWRGDARNPQLQRIYGTAFANRKDLDAYLHQLEEAERRDHRRIGREMDLFHVQEEAPGSVFWHPHGWTLWRQVEGYIRRRLGGTGYVEVKTPQLVDKVLWERSGHADKFGSDMFFLEADKRTYALKPMNCPCHVQVFNQHLHSYRDLPLRMAEFGSCHRNEPSGALHGMMRVRGFTQDDGHIFCTEDQIQDEVAAFNKVVREVYDNFGFTDVAVKLALRPEKRIGEEAVWDKAENALREAIRASGTEWEELPGEGAFYGPKIEYHLKDSIGRSWQCGTMQVDFSMPARLGAEYVTEDNDRKVPVMLHRAIVGSLERFIAILIENHAGAMPLWLAPEQVVILNISDAQAEYVKNVAQTLKKQGFRVVTDLRNEKITYKIRQHSLQKPPYILVVGDKERDTNTVAVRARGNVDLGVMPIDVLVERLRTEVEAKA